MVFTFIVLVYNQEKLILETLESIKYQTQKNAHDYMVDLIIIDDCSKDGSVDVVQQWISNNQEVFRNCNFIVNDTNKGTVINYNLGISLINEGNFKVIAGDDVFGSCNLFECFEDLCDEKIKSYFPLYLVDGEIIFDKKRYVTFYYNKYCKKSKKYNLKAIRKGGYFHTPSTIYTKNLYDNAKCRDLNTRFRLFEDDPTWYSMIKNIDELQVEFSTKTIVLYRMHSASVSNSINPVFLEELHRLNQMYLEDVRGIERFVLLCKDKSYTKRVSLYKIINKLLYFYMVLCVKNQRRFKEELADIENRIKREQQYYNCIKYKEQEEV